MSLAETSVWLDAPRLAAWLEEHGLRDLEVQLGPNCARRVREWRRGGAAEVWTADRILTRLGLHLSEIPEELWLEEQPRGKPRGAIQKLPESTVAAIYAAKQQGRPTGEVARELGISKSSVKVYTRKLRAVAA